MQTADKRRLHAYFIALFYSLEIVLSFSLFGYITTPGITLSFLPVIIFFMGYLFNPAISLGAGLIFGLTSIWMASVEANSATDILYSPVLSGNPFASIVLAIGTRLLLGLMAGLFLQAAKKASRHRGVFLVIAVCISEILYMFSSYIVTAVGFPEIEITAARIQDSIILSLLLECSVPSIAIIGLNALMKSEKTQRFLQYCQFGTQKIPTKWALPPIFAMTAFFALSGFGTTLQYLKLNTVVMEKAGQPFNKYIVDLLNQFELQQQVSYLALSFIIVTAAMIVYFYNTARQSEILQRADSDAMTGLYNRTAFKNRIQQYMEQHPGEINAFLLIDIDDLKKINDSFGHAVGDEAILGIANALTSGLRETDLVARVGGDEFAVFLCNVVSREKLIPILERLQKTIRTATIAGNQTFLRASIGIALGKAGIDDFDTLYRRADEALYRVKNNDKNIYAFFEDYDR